MGSMMDRRDFAHIAEDTLTEYIASPPRDHRTRVVRMTSGTTGGQPVVFIREQQEDPPGWFDDTKKLALCGGSVPWRLGWVLLFRDAKTSHPAQVLTLDIRDLSGDLSSLISDFRPDTFSGFPSSIARVSEHLERAVGEGVHSLVMTGETLRSAILEIFRTRFPNAILRMQYLISEIGYVSFPRYCPYLPLHSYHPARGINGVELDILDPDETGAGELLVSARINRSIELKKYRYGDLARIRRVKCACGEDVTFEIIGRSGYDFIRLAGATLRREEFDRVAKLCAHIFDDYRVEASGVNVDGALKGKILLRVFRDDGAWTEKMRDEVIEIFSKGLFLTLSQTLSQLVGADVFLPLEVVFSKQPFPVKHKDMKLVQKNS